MLDEWLSLVVALAAFIVSGLAYWQAVSAARSGTFVQAALARDRALGDLADFGERCEALKARIGTVAAMRGASLSSRRTVAEDQVEHLAGEAERLRQRIDAAAQGLDDLKGRALERSLVQLSAIRLDASRLVGEVQGLEETWEAEERRARLARGQPA